MFGARGDKVVASVQRKIKEGLRDFGAHHMAALVVVIGMATAIAVVAGEWVVRAGHECRAQDVACFSSGGHFLIL